MAKCVIRGVCIFDVKYMVPSQLAVSEYRLYGDEPFVPVHWNQIRLNIVPKKRTAKYKSVGLEVPKGKSEVEYEARTGRLPTPVYYTLMYDMLDLLKKHPSYLDKLISDTSDCKLMMRRVNVEGTFSNFEIVIISQNTFATRLNLFNLEIVLIAAGPVYIGGYEYSTMLNNGSDDDTIDYYTIDNCTVKQRKYKKLYTELYKKLSEAPSFDNFIEGIKKSLAEVYTRKATNLIKSLDVKR